MTEIVKVRMRNRLSGTIGSGQRDFPPHEDDAEDEPDEHQAADPRIGPVGVPARCVSPIRNGAIAAVKSAAPT